MSSSVSIFDKNIESIFSKLFRVKKERFVQSKDNKVQSNIIHTQKEVIFKEKSVNGGSIYLEEEIKQGSNEQKNPVEISFFIY